MSDLSGIYHYHRIGHDEREIELCPDGSIGDGAQRAERRWWVRLREGKRNLSLVGDYGEICRLQVDADGCWRGNWRLFERMPIELVPKHLQALRSFDDRAGINYLPDRFHYISYAQLVKDSMELARRLPPLRAVAGIPRSGMIPASLISLDRNVPLISIESLLSPEPLAIPLPRRAFGNRTQEGIILVVDDTSASGRQADQIRKLARHPIQLAAIYVEDRAKICVDYFHSKLPDFAQFYEWTMFHDANNAHLLVDLDGVLCDDWTGGSETCVRTGADPRLQQANPHSMSSGRGAISVFTEDSAAYLNFLENVAPRRIPSHPLNGIVTNRLERHRPQTEAWLKAHRIQYGMLTMSPYATFEERDRANDAAKRKAKVYAANPSLRLFVESDDHQALEIAKLTRRPVFSIARNGLV
jgi:hypothetical protein